ncbi:MAG: hypothetical protein RIS64_416 [Bacteroidota bacterium]|jgi:hypothetical protein
MVLSIEYVLQSWFVALKINYFYIYYKNNTYFWLVGWLVGCFIQLLIINNLENQLKKKNAASCNLQHFSFLSKRLIINTI